MRRNLKCPESHRNPMLGIVTELLMTLKSFIITRTVESLKRSKWHLRKSPNGWIQRLCQRRGHFEYIYLLIAHTYMNKSHVIKFISLYRSDHESSLKKNCSRAMGIVSGRKVSLVDRMTFLVAAQRDDNKDRRISKHERMLTNLKSSNPKSPITIFPLWPPTVVFHEIFKRVFRNNFTPSNRSTRSEHYGKHFKHSFLFWRKASQNVFSGDKVVRHTVFNSTKLYVNTLRMRKKTS